MPTAEDALRSLAQATAAAVEGVLVEHAAPGTIERGDPASVAAGPEPLGAVDFPGVVCVATVGDRGRFLLALSNRGARVLAALVTGTEPPEPGDEAPSDLDLSAIGGAMDRAMAAAASATAAVLGVDATISPAETTPCSDRGEAEAALGSCDEAFSTAFVIADQPARFVQLVPASSLVGPTARAESPDRVGLGADVPADRSGAVQADSLRGIPVELWAELGRFRMEAGRAVALAPGSVVELDAAIEAPVDVFVNGRRLGTARLLVGAEGEWAIRLEELIDAELDFVAPTRGQS